jgi:tetratricopeptide (TPR) repeat protein
MNGRLEGSPRPTMPLQEVLQVLAQTPTTDRQLRAVLAFTAARWTLERGDEKRAVQQFGEALIEVPELRPAMRMLYRIYGDRNDVRNAVTYLDQEIRATRHPREAAALYRERGQLVERYFRDLRAAQQCHEAALKATPRDLAVLRSVERVSLARGDVFGTIANLESQLEVLEDKGAAAGLLHDLALLEARHGGDLDLAADMLLHALELVPGHLGLISDLFRMAELAGDTALMLQALEAEAEARDARQRSMPLARASLVLLDQRERPAAVALLLAAAEAQPDNFSLWRNLEELAMSSSRYEIAMMACLGQLRAIGEGEPAARAELFYRVGRLAMIRLDRVNEGLAAMRKALRLFPAHVPAVEDTARYLISNGLWAQLLELLKLQASTAREAGLTKAETAQAFLRAGQVLEEHLGELEGARRLYEEASSAAPAYRPARDRLERVLHQMGRTEDLAEFYEAEMRSASGTARRVFLLSVLGQLHAGDEDPKQATKCLVALLKEVPEHMPSLQRLARLLARAGRTKELLKVTEQEIKLTLSPIRKAKLLHRSGELAIELGEPDRARECFEEALSAIDDHQPSMTGLELLLRDDRDYEALLALLRRRLRYTTGDRTRQVGLRLEIASILSTRLDRPEDALAELEALLERWPRHLPALHAAESLATRLSRWDVLVKLLEQHVGAVQGPRTRALLLHRSANVRATHLEDPEGAIRELVRALELWPQLGVARALLLRLYEQLGRARDLQAFAEAGLTTERGADDRRALALQLAELTPKAVVAIQYLGAVAEARPDDFVTQLRLARAAQRARRPSRAAGALEAAAARFAEQLPTNDPGLLAYGYRAARAEEAAGNLDKADAGYAKILDIDPGHALARRGRLRVKRKRQSSFVGGSDDLQKAGAATADAIEQAAYATIAAELHERRGDLDGALARAEQALVACGEYLPALHCKARVLERLGEPRHVTDAIATLERLADVSKVTAHRVRALSRAGSISLRTADPSAHNSRAWGLFARALALEPADEVAFRGLERTRLTHGVHGAPPLQILLERRIATLDQRGESSPTAVREVARLAGHTDGPEAAVELLEQGLERWPEDPGIHADLAQGYARLERWPEVVAELERALQRELSPERAAALHYFAGDAEERAGHPQRAIGHYLAAGRGGYHPRHALLSADRIAAEYGALDQRVEALQLMVDLGDGEHRVRSLRALADIHRGSLGKPDVAVELMRELLLLEPTDLGVLRELHRLLLKLDRTEEAKATLLAGVAHHRAWLRAEGVRSKFGRSAGKPGREGIDHAPVRGLRELFELLGDIDGVYLATGILEVTAPDELDAGLPDCDRLQAEPWPLPNPQDGKPLDLLVGDLPSSNALDLLHEGVFLLSELPKAPKPPVDVQRARSLPSNSGVVMVARALADALGIPQPLVFVEQNAEDQELVVAHLGATPALIVGRKINSAPFAPRSRDLLGRALMRLATGGDYLNDPAAEPQLLGLLLGLCRALGIELPSDAFSSTRGDDPTVDRTLADWVVKSLPDAAGRAELAQAARTFAQSTDTFDPQRLRDALAMAQDRAGVVAAADPRPALARVLETEGLTGERATALLGYLLSDDHLGLRRSLGYQVALQHTVELELEEVPG